MPRCSSIDMIKFVKEYGKHRCLWDINDPNYRRRLARDVALKSIVNNLGINGLDTNTVRKKLRIIRSSYWNEHNKIQKFKASGRIYQPKVLWFNIADKFLKKVTNWTGGSGICVESGNAEHENDDYNEILDDDEKSTMNETFHPTISINNNEKLINPSSIVARITSQNLNSNEKNMLEINGRNNTLVNDENSELLIMENRRETENYENRNDDVRIQEGNCSSSNGRRAQKHPRTSRNPKKEKYYNYKKKINVAVHNLNSFLEKCNEHKEDQFDVFGKNIAAHMRNMPVKDAIICQQQIQNYITDYRLNMLQKST